MKFTLVAAKLWLFTCFAAFSVLAAAPETPWEALRHLSKHHVYTVLNRDGSCLTGSFVSVSENAFVIEQAGEQILPKSEIVRISTGENADVHTTVYSARSSWADLEALQTPPYYAGLLLITADARQFSGSLLGVSNDQLTVIVDHKEMRFSKDFLARVFLTGKKASYDGMFWNPVGLSKRVLAPTQPVPLYEVTAREDNSTLDCSSADARKKEKPAQPNVQHH